MAKMYTKNSKGMKTMTLDEINLISLNDLPEQSKN